MNEGQASELKDALGAVYPDAKGIEVSPGPDGALIVITGIQAAGNSEAGHDDLRVSIGNGDSPVLRQLLTGRPDTSG
jgi:hypothetical protein